MQGHRWLRESQCCRGMSQPRSRIIFERVCSLTQVKAPSSRVSTLKAIGIVIILTPALIATNRACSLLVGRRNLPRGACEKEASDAIDLGGRTRTLSSLLMYSTYSSGTPRFSGAVLLQPLRRQRLCRVGVRARRCPGRLVIARSRGARLGQAPPGRRLRR